MQNKKCVKNNVGSKIGKSMYLCLDVSLFRIDISYQNNNILNTRTVWLKSIKIMNNLFNKVSLISI